MSAKCPWPDREWHTQWCVGVCTWVCVCVGTHVLISHRNQGLAGGVYLKEIAGMQLLDFA